ncbi:FxsC protein [Streptomyces sp. B3I8]|uniref:FxsC protein n=1 Tax=Streptomyces sp. B3I8 TaxID=3042303 RepID=UPI0027820E01|nr:FxsC protein [Streptomyces sp. B3I8]MDQ0791093.1 FxsC-like protein [Streptomyces sp. B3I8]
MSHFYLSHVRRVDEEWVAAFFRDLSVAVGARIGRPPETLGSRGDPYTLDVPLDSLSRSTVLVALLSPRYFSQSYCVAEWNYFQQRLDVHWSRTGRRADAVIPVVWEPDPDHPPAVTSPISPLHVPSQAYQRDGVLHLLRLKARYQDEYGEVLDALARRIAAAREELPEMHGFRTTTGAGVRPGAREGRRAIDFVMASMSRQELPADRQARHFYGDRSLDWSPYAPEDKGALASLVTDVATALDFAPDILALDDTAVDRVGADPDRLVVLLVDAWVARIREKQRLFSAVDGRPGRSTTVLEPRSEDDTESAAQAAELDDAVDRMLPLLRHSFAEYQRWSLPDSERFTSALRKALIRLQNDAMKSVEAERAPAAPATGLAPFPLLGRRSS